MIIGLSGHIKSGKSTAATISKKINPTFDEKYFAYKLKQIAALLTGDNIRNFETQEGKDGTLEEWGMTRREILQKLGTESLRNNFHDQVWIKALFADYKPDANGEYPNWLLSDVRFPNEASAVKQMGGVLIRVNRPFELIYPELWRSYTNLEFESFPILFPSDMDFVRWLNNPNATEEMKDLYKKVSHKSETDLDNYNEFDLVIDNVGTLEEFETKLYNFLTSLQHVHEKN